MEVKRELKVNFNNEILPFFSEPNYLGVTLDRSLPYRQHFESLRKKLTSRVALLRRLAGSGWVLEQQRREPPPWSWYTQPKSTGLLSGATELTAASFTLPSTTPCWLSPDACVLHLRTTFLYLQASILLIFVAKEPYSPERLAMEPAHLLRSALTCPQSANAQHFKSRLPFVPATQQLIISSDNNYIGAAHWADHLWNAEWADNPKRRRTFIPDTGTHPPGMTLPRTAWVRHNRLRTGVGRFRSCVRKWVWLPLQPVNVVQKNKPSPILSSNVQSIDLPMDFTARVSMRWGLFKSLRVYLPSVNTYIVACVGFAINKWLKCIYCKRRLIFDGLLDWFCDWASPLADGAL